LNNGQGLFLLGALAIFVVGAYTYLFIQYLALSAIIAVFASKWADRLDAVSGKIGEKGDTLFFPLLAVTNFLFWLAAHYVSSGVLVECIKMILEGIHSGFNGARVKSIMFANNNTRSFNLLEVLVETFLIEIAPVSLLCSFMNGETLEDPWDFWGAWLLIPLFFLLLFDFNTAGAKPKEVNAQIAARKVSNGINFLLKNLENIVAVCSVIILVLTVGRGQRPRHR